MGGEALEEQQQVAEDRMHSLEQEQAYLAQQLMQRSLDDAHDDNISPVAVGCTGGSEAVAGAIARNIVSAVDADEDAAVVVRQLGEVAYNFGGDAKHLSLV